MYRTFTSSFFRSCLPTCKNSVWKPIVRSTSCFRPCSAVKSYSKDRLSLRMSQRLTFITPLTRSKGLKLPYSELTGEKWKETWSYQSIQHCNLAQTICFSYTLQVPLSRRFATKAGGTPKTSRKLSTVDTGDTSKNVDSDSCSSKLEDTVFHISIKFTNSWTLSFSPRRRWNVSLSVISRRPLLQQMRTNENM